MTWRMPWIHSSTILSRASFSLIPGASITSRCPFWRRELFRPTSTMALTQDWSPLWLSPNSISSFGTFFLSKKIFSPSLVLDLSNTLIWMVKFSVLLFWKKKKGRGDKNVYCNVLVQFSHYKKELMAQVGSFPTIFRSKLAPKKNVQET